MPVSRLIDKTQADGEAVLEVGFGGNMPAASYHQIQLTVKDTGVITVPTAGTLTIKVKSPGGAEDHEDIVDNVIDMTDRTQWLQGFSGYAQEVSFTPTGFDAGKTYDITLISGEK